MQSSPSSKAHLMFDQILEIPIGITTAYIGPKVIDILHNLIQIIISGESSSDSLSTWTSDQGINLVGMAAGALIGYKLCQYFLISNLTYKIGSMVILSLLGDKTVDFYRRTTTAKEGQLSY